MYRVALLLLSAPGILIGQINTGCEEHPKELPGEFSVGYFIAETALGRGYTTEAVKGLTELFDYYRLYR